MALDAAPVSAGPSSHRPYRRLVLPVVAAACVAISFVWLSPDWIEALGMSAVSILAVSALFVAVTPKLSHLAFTFWMFAFIFAAMTHPALFVSWGEFDLKRAIVPLIQVIMLGMGTTLSIADFVRVARMPKAVLVGIGLQFTVMPVLAVISAAVFGLSSELALGLVLVGSCPGGVSSNVITYLARGNLALSVTMTACSTMLSPLATPLAMRLLAGRSVPIPVESMMLSILQMIVTPVVVGLLITRYAPKAAAWAKRFLPGASMFAICMIIAVTIAISRDDLLVAGAALLGASVVHNGGGYLLGYWGARAAGLDGIDSRTVSIEVGLQNCGMATGLAFGVFKSTLVALASAVFGPWSAISGSVLASWWRRHASR